MCACVYVVAQRFHCLCVWVCHRFYSTDYFSPLPFAPSLPLSSLSPTPSLLLRVFVLLHWLVYFPFGFDAPRAMWLRLWLWPAAFRQPLWLFTFSTCKTKMEGTRKLSFAGQGQPWAWKGVNKCAGNSSGNVFISFASFSSLCFFQLCFALMRRKETLQKVALTLTGFQNILPLSHSHSPSLFFSPLLGTI